MRRMRARRPRAIRAPDDGRTEWFAGGAGRATRVPRGGPLPQFGGLVALDQIEVDLDPQARREVEFLDQLADP